MNIDNIIYTYSTNSNDYFHILKYEDSSLHFNDVSILYYGNIKILAQALFFDAYYWSLEKKSAHNNMNTEWAGNLNYNNSFNINLESEEIILYRAVNEPVFWKEFVDFFKENFKLKMFL